jgi:hypothetical protein
MIGTKPAAEPILKEALVDIRTLAIFALQSSDQIRMKRDLEMILTIAEMVLPSKKRP